MVARIPKVSAGLLANIPRIESVIEAVQYQNQRYDGAGSSDEQMPVGQDISLAARVLKIVLDFDALESQGLSRLDALDEMSKREGWYDPDLLSAFATIRESVDKLLELREIGSGELVIGMSLAENLYTTKGVLLIGKGQEVNDSLLERIQNFAKTSGVQEPIRVLVPKRNTELDLARS